MNNNSKVLSDIKKARILAILGDSVTTDHISPAGSIKEESPAGHYLKEKQVSVEQFNSYGARRGSHEVMIRGTFANIRLKNKITPDKEGGFTKLYPENKEVMGEITLVIEGEKKEQNQELNEADLKKDLQELIKAGLSISAASKYLAKKHGIKKNIIYNLN